MSFSEEDQVSIISGVGFVVFAIVWHGGMRRDEPLMGSANDVRYIAGGGYYIGVFADQSVVICKQRDVKGPYASGRRGSRIFAWR